MSKASGHYRGLERIVSGGQTGVDRAALEVAIELGIPHGGWCPRGRLAENGPIPAKFELRETISPVYHIRTEQNVLDSDGTLILHRGKLKGGTLLTRRLAKTHGRPLLEFDVDAEPLPDLIFQWLRDHQIRILNVAGPRESSNPGVQSAAHVWLASLLANRPQNG